MKAPTTINTAVSYTYALKGAGDSVIGNLQGFNPSFNRELQRVRELGDWDNDIKEIVPGRGDFTLTVERLEMYANNAVAAITGNSQDPMGGLLVQQTAPFTITEKLTKGGDSGATRSVIYKDCWIQGYSKSVREGTLLVTEQVTIWPTSITMSNS